MAAGYAIGVVILTPFTLMLVFRTIDARVRDYLRVLVPYLWMSMVMTLAVLAVFLLPIDNTAVQLVMAVAVGVATYSGLLWLTRPPALGDALSAVRGGLR